ncbi:hypothetical protein [Ornithinimicrobium cerasi]|nr:hypothetical protein [Ornithinimicrobium cerasi]
MVWWFVIAAACILIAATPAVVLFLWRISAQLQTLIELQAADVDDRV